MLVLFSAVGHWNSYFPALIYNHSRDLYPLQLVLREILITSNVESMTTSVSSGDTFKVAQTINAPTLADINEPLKQVPENAGMWAFRTVGAFA